ncbi:outer spore coat protein CotE [Psychrobacillus vulpis]|uniref:Outer spore coat protein CotE n=1 Tax=Psychrobacillus vulpis TaxID=2325572 RepID=A0A544TU88_9BACI|nr:outer spore coat protein CotE [Psychrobacillus vulpis]TQR21015.1 outer spore coat protein CotE [Psychrobacillus vulpis]
MKIMRQIVTKAVVAKGKKRTESCEVLCPPNTPSSILGCWVINHSCQSKKHGRYVEVTGKFDINVWYAHHDHSKTSVFTETINYKDKIKLHYRDKESTGEEVHVRVLQQPNCTEAIIIENGTKFQVTVERELLAEVVGETTVCIQVLEQDFEEEWAFNEESSSISSRPSSTHSEHNPSSSI